MTIKKVLPAVAAVSKNPNLASDVIHFLPAKCVLRLLAVPRNVTRFFSFSI
jgi:hypothetical protein